jgi:hypothetical protein
MIYTGGDHSMIAIKFHSVGSIHYIFLGYTSQKTEKPDMFLMSLYLTLLEVFRPQIIEELGATVEQMWHVSCSNLIWAQQHIF